MASVSIWEDGERVGRRMGRGGGGSEGGWGMWRGGGGGGRSVQAVVCALLCFAFSSVGECLDDFLGSEQPVQMTCRE